MDYLPHEYLKMAFHELVVDKTTGDVAMQTLLASARARAKRECDDIIEAAAKVRREFWKDAQKRARELHAFDAPVVMPGARVKREDDDLPARDNSNDQAADLLEVDDLFSRLTTPFLGQAIKLCYLGQLVDGPILAWKCLLAVVKFAIHNWEEGAYRLPRDQNGRGFHKLVDNYMLEICRAQKDYGQTAWLSDQARKDVQQLKTVIGENTYDHRYDKTRAFLEQCQSQVMEQDMDLFMRNRIG